MGKQSVSTKPVTGEPVTVKGTIPFTAKPSMNPPTQPVETTSGINLPARMDLIASDVNESFNALREFEQRVHGGRIGPNGRWTQLIERFCYSLKDWNEIKQAFLATLRTKLAEQIKNENPKPEGLNDHEWNSLVQGMVDVRMKTGSVQTLVSQFSIIGRFFGKNGPGKERLVELLKGTGQERVTYAGTLRLLASAVPTGRGRKAGSTNMAGPVSNAKKEEGNSTPTIVQVETNADDIKAKTRISTRTSAIAFIGALHPTAEFLIPVMRALANKFKEAAVPELQVIGAMMIDEITPPQSDDDEGEEEPQRKAS